MERSEIEKTVTGIVCEQLGVAESEVNTDSSFVDDLGADSLDTVELVMALEEEFGLEIADEDAEKISTCLLYTSPSPRDGRISRMPSSA